MKYNFYTLGELAKIRYGKNQKKVQTESGVIPIYGTGGLMGYATDPIYSKPSVLIGRKGTINKVRYVDHPFWTVDTLFYTEVNEKLVIPKYLYYIMSLLDLDAYNEGTTIPSLRTETLNRLEFNIPDISYQKKVLSIFDPIDKKIDIDITINKNLEEQAQAIFDSFYERANSEVPFTSIIQILGGGTPKTKEESYWNGDIPFFTPKDVGNPYTLSTEKFITSTGLENCNSRLYPINTTFVTARGTVGKVSLAGVPMAMNQSCYALSGNNIHPLMTYFYTLKTVQSLRHKASGAVFDAIVTSDFKSEILRCISENDSMQLLNSIEPMMDRILEGSIENTRLAQLRDTLLPRLMSGEIDVSSIEV